MNDSNKSRATIVFNKDMVGVILQSIDTLISYGWLEIEEKDITEGSVNESINLKLKWHNRSPIKEGDFKYDYRVESKEITSLKDYFNFMCFVLDIQGRERYYNTTGSGSYYGSEKYYVLESLFVSADLVEDDNYGRN